MREARPDPLAVNTDAITKPRWARLLNEREDQVFLVLTLMDLLDAELTAAQHTATLTDGEMFYQISEGRRPMPAFKIRLTDDQRWQLVLLVRSFSAPAASKAEAGRDLASPAKK